MANKVRSIVGGSDLDAVESLGSVLRIGSKSRVARYGPGYKLEFREAVGIVSVGIGKNHVGYLVIGEEGLKALREGEEVEIAKHIKG